jgi:hypothetical protein
MIAIKLSFRFFQQKKETSSNSSTTSSTGGSDKRSCIDWKPVIDNNDKPVGKVEKLVKLPSKQVFDATFELYKFKTPKIMIKVCLGSAQGQ